MYHPNSELEKCNATQELKYWDQRIPNEPLLDRNFVIHHPPVIYNNRPQTTDPCIGVDREWLLLDNKLEKKSSRYWCTHLNSQKYHGIPTQTTVNGSKIKYKPTKRENQQYSKCKHQRQDRPWIHGTNINIDAESKLKRLDYYNPKDCIANNVREQLQKSYIQAVHALHQGQGGNYLQHTPLWLNNPTRMINQEPFSYDYTSQLNTCAVKSHLWGGTP